MRAPRIPWPARNPLPCPVAFSRRATLSASAAASCNAAAWTLCRTVVSTSARQVGWLRLTFAASKALCHHALAPIAVDLQSRYQKQMHQDATCAWTTPAPHAANTRNYLCETVPWTKHELSVEATLPRRSHAYPELS